MEEEAASARAIAASTVTVGVVAGCNWAMLLEEESAAAKELQLQEAVVVEAAVEEQEAAEQREKGNNPRLQEADNIREEAVVDSVRERLREGRWLA